MGYKTIIMIISILSTSCSAVNFATQPDVTTRDYSMFNSLGSKHNSKILLLDGEEIATKYVFVKNDSLYYVSTQDTLSISLIEVEKVEIKHLGKKISSGLLYGGISFLVSFVAIAFTVGGGGLGAGLVALPLGAGFGLGGFSLGLIYGNGIEYIFNDKANYEQIEYYKNYHKKRAERDSTNLGS